MPDNQLVRDILADTDNALLKSLVEVYLSLPSDTTDAHAAAIAQSLEKTMQECADANCPD
jgi:hypothetical protein